MMTPDKDKMRCSAKGIHPGETKPAKKFDQASASTSATQPRSPSTRASFWDLMRSVAAEDAREDESDVSSILSYEYRGPYPASQHTEAAHMDSRNGSQSGPFDSRNAHQATGSIVPRINSSTRSKRNKRRRRCSEPDVAAGDPVAVGEPIAVTGGRDRAPRRYRQMCSCTAGAICAFLFSTMDSEPMECSGQCDKEVVQKE
eukprot:GEMP01060165.1.p1 GENE.GEMP01060165.1~~GEMP01060165.1.p1  ORF type:complete len:201 (+),score=23.37 GEMP01060165.1:389-991(+)